MIKEKRVELTEMSLGCEKKLLISFFFFFLDKKYFFFLSFTLKEQITK